MDRVIFDFFNKRRTYNALCEHFKLKKTKDLWSYLSSKDWSRDDCPYFDFIKDYNIPFAQFDVENVYIRCKHVTTYHDEGRTLKEFGLINLQRVLEKDTLFSRFLAENGIIIDVKNKLFILNGQKYPIFERDDECPFCQNNRICNFSYHDAIKLLYIKLYHHKAETEVFFGKDDNRRFENYSCVKRHPEILNQMDDILDALNRNKKLSKKWEKLQNGLYYTLEFDLNISNFETINSKKYGEGVYSNVFEYFKDYLSYSGYKRNDFEEDRIPQRLYSNIFLVENSLRLFANMKIYYGQIFPWVTIDYNDLRITPRSL
jgi:hypothetical protein